MKISNFTCNNKCSNCGGCCIPVLPITMKEYQEIKEYIKEHSIKAMPLYDHNNIYMDCPFHDRINKKCNIYPARPAVCREFLCSKSEKELEKNRLYYDERAELNGKNIHKFVPFDLLFYDDPFLSIMYAKDLLGKHCNQHNLVTLLYNFGKDMPSDIPNTTQVADAILKGDIKLEWSD